MKIRSYLYAPGHDEKLLERVFTAGSDAVVLDLEDAVPAGEKQRARARVREAIAAEPAWVRVNAPGTPDCASDLTALADRVAGIRVPKVESRADVEWVAERAPGVALGCTIETAKGILAAADIAASDEVVHLVFGGADLALDLGIAGGELEFLFARASLVAASRAAGIDPPVDSVYANVDDGEGLRREAISAMRLGFFGKSAIHPRQVPIVNEVFTPTCEELGAARRVVEAFTASQGAACRLEDGSFVDRPIAERARRLLEQVEGER